MFVSAYFTKLKIIWDELGNFRPTCSCANYSCGGIRALANHYQIKYIMSFLIRLNESFAQVRAQLLLMNPIPLINKVFALISQEEKQRSVVGRVNTDSVSFNVKYKVNKSNHNKSS